MGLHAARERQRPGRLTRQPRRGHPRVAPGPDRDRRGVHLRPRARRVEVKDGQPAGFGGGDERAASSFVARVPRPEGERGDRQRRVRRPFRDTAVVDVHSWRRGRVVAVEARTVISDSPKRFGHRAQPGVEENHGAVDHGEREEGAAVARGGGGDGKRECPVPRRGCRDGRSVRSRVRTRRLLLRPRLSPRSVGTTASREGAFVAPVSWNIASRLTPRHVTNAASARPPVSRKWSVGAPTRPASLGSLSGFNPRSRRLHPPPGRRARGIESRRRPPDGTVRKSARRRRRGATSAP